MCGIAGLVLGRGGVVPGELARVLQCRLEHRGPDDLGYLRLDGAEVHCGRNWMAGDQPGEALLVHRRLSILDLHETGWQPMASEDGRYHIVFNGEIYNYLELRAELERAGHRFRSHSDTEVLLAAVAEWGTACLPRLVGMFAFALLDTQRRRLLLARDPFGIKPLYYSFTDRGFAFASELKALLELPGVSRRVDAAQLYDYLAYGRIEHGPQTLLAGVQQLPPAHWMELSVDEPRPVEGTPYWRAGTQSTLDLSFEDAAARMRELFLESVSLHLRSDVPLGANLSGGIDSSAIVAAMRQVGGPGLDLHTFSYVADDPRVSEERWIDLAGRAVGATMHKTGASAASLRDDIEKLLDVQDLPFGSTSIYAQYRVFALARERGITVVLDGQGADELLGGYRLYATARVISLVRAGRAVEAIRFLRHASRWPGREGLWRDVLWSLAPGAVRLVHRVRRGDDRIPWLDPQWFAERGIHAGPGVVPPRTLRDTLVETLTTSSVPALLRYEDRNSMAHSIESRVPFLTTAFADFALALPEHYIVDRDGMSKAVFRRAMRGLVPDAILDRRDKLGFATPEMEWLSVLAPWVDRALSDDSAERVPALRPEAMRAEWAAIRRGARPFDFRVWRWINLIEWSRAVGARFD